MFLALLVDLDGEVHVDERAALGAGTRAGCVQGEGGGMGLDLDFLQGGRGSAIVHPGLVDAELHREDARVVARTVRVAAWVAVGALQGLGVAERPCALNVQYDIAIAPWRAAPGNHGGQTGRDDETRRRERDHHCQSMRGPPPEPLRVHRASLL
jgi:hypothetical protein